LPLHFLFSAFLFFIFVKKKGFKKIELQNTPYQYCIIINAYINLKFTKMRSISLSNGCVSLRKATDYANAVKTSKSTTGKTGKSTTVKTIKSTTVKTITSTTVKPGKSTTVRSLLERPMTQKQLLKIAMENNNLKIAIANDSNIARARRSEATMNLLNV